MKFLPFPRGYETQTQPSRPSLMIFESVLPVSWRMNVVQSIENVEESLLLSSLRYRAKHRILQAGLLIS